MYRQQLNEGIIERGKRPIPQKSNNSNCIFTRSNETFVVLKNQGFDETRKQFPGNLHRRFQKRLMGLEVEYMKLDRS